MKTSSIKRKRIKPPVQRVSKDKFTSLSAELTLSLKSLKLQTKESVQNWSMRLQADIAHIIEDIHAIQPDRKKSKMVKVIPIVRRINNMVQAVKVKPEKGRLKDLKHLHELVKNIRRLTNSLDK
jgi:hypothetical protein